MKIFSAQLKGTTTVATGANVSLTGSFSGSIAGIDINTNNTFTASTIARLNAIETISASNIDRISSLETTSASINILNTTQNSRLDSLETTSASVNTLNTIQNSRLDSLEIKTGSLASTGSNFFIGSQTITGSLYISADLVVQGTSSIQNITGSSINIGTNIVNLNTATPAVRYAGLTVQDSGSSAGVTGSFLWDSLCNRWLYSNPSTVGYSGGIIMSGPRAATFGTETTLTCNYIAKSGGGDHLYDSSIYESGSCVGIGINTPETTLHIAANSPYLYFDDLNSTGTKKRTRFVNGDVGNCQSLTIGFGCTNNTSNIDVLTLNELGNIGLGTTTPNSGKVEIQTNNNSPALWVQTGGTTTSYCVASFRTGTNAAAFEIYGNATSYFGGNVGIGQSPSYPLHVVGAANNACFNIVSTVTSAGYAYNYVANQGGLQSLWGSESTGAFIGTNSNSYFYFLTNGTERARITADGKLNLKGLLQSCDKIGTCDDKGFYFRGTDDVTHKIYYKSVSGYNNVIWEYNSTLYYQYYAAGTPVTRLSLTTDGNLWTQGTFESGNNAGIRTSPCTTYYLKTGDAGITGYNTYFGTGQIRIGGGSDHTTNVLLSVAPGCIHFDAPGIGGGRMAINSTGVGIGTTSLCGRFHVNAGGMAAGAPQYGWPYYNAELDSSTKPIVLEGGGNGGVSTAGTGPTVGLILGTYFDSRALITPYGAGSSSPADQGTGRGKDLLIKGGTADNTNTYKGGRLFLNGGVGYNGGAYGSCVGDIILQCMGSDGKVGIGGATGSSGRLLVYDTGCPITSGNITFGTQAKGIEVYNYCSGNTDNVIGYWISTGPHKAGIASGRTNAASTWEVDLRFYVHPTDIANLDNTYERMRLYGGGNLTINGSLTQNGSLSDINLKENIVKISNPLQKISCINGYTFEWKKGSPARRDFSNIINDAGLIAQEVENVMPDIVRENECTKALNYNGVIGLLVEGIKVQQCTIDILKSCLGII